METKQESLTSLATFFLDKKEQAIDLKKKEEKQEEDERLAHILIDFEINFKELLPLLKADNVEYYATKSRKSYSGDMGGFYDSDSIRFKKPNAHYILWYSANDTKAEESEWMPDDHGAYGRWDLKDIAIRIYREVVLKSKEHQDLPKSKSKTSADPYDELRIIESTGHESCFRTQNPDIVSIKKRLFGGWIIRFKSGEVQHVEPLRF